MIVKIHEDQGRKIICVTDSEIIGKKFEEGNRQLDLTVDYYQGDEKGKDEVKELIKEAYIIHLTGKEAVGLGIELDLVESGHIISIDGVPHAEAVVDQKA